MHCLLETFTSGGEPGVGPRVSHCVGQSICTSDLASNLFPLMWSPVLTCSFGISGWGQLTLGPDSPPAAPSPGQGGK